MCIIVIIRKLIGDEESNSRNINNENIVISKENMMAALTVIAMIMPIMIIVTVIVIVTITIATKTIKDIPMIYSIYEQTLAILMN